jgi:hypothetical protein
MSRDDRDGDLAPATGPGDRAIARVKAMDAERIARADPLYPGSGSRSFRDGEAAALAAATRSQVAAHRGELVAPRSALPGEPALVADALVVSAEAGMIRLGRDDLRAAQRDLAETLVDLQSFRPDEEAARILSDQAGAIDELESLLAARAAIIAMLRDDDLSVVGNMNALRDLDLRIGDGRAALDAVDRYRVKQALGLLAVAGFPVVVAVVVVAIILILVIGPAS